MAFRRRLSRKWRGVARELWVKHDGNIEACRDEFEQTYGNLAAILTIIQVVMFLWELWKKWKVAEPSEFPSEAEEREFEFHYDDDEDE